MNNPVSILLMDEDATILEQLQTVLQREGYQVLIAADGNAALRLAKTVQPALIVSELLLAGVDGYEVWRMLRTDPEVRPIPVLVVSSLAVPARNEPWRATPHNNWQLLSYDAFLPKPLDLRRFIRVVKRLIAPQQAPLIPAGPSVVIGVEDTELQKQIADILGQHDFGVETPASLKKAMQLVKAIPSAALLLDYRGANQVVLNLIRENHKYIPSTIVAAIIDQDQAIDAEAARYFSTFVAAPLHPALMVTGLNHGLDLMALHRRTENLSTQLIFTHRNLSLTQQALLAQNEELAYTNHKLREMDVLKETLTGMVVHDLKAPLGAVLGALNFLLTSPQVQLPPNFERLITGAVAAGHQLMRLTETLLEGQRLEEGHLKPDKEPFDLPTLLEATLGQFEPLLALHRLTVECHVPADLPLLYADPHIAQRILENLLDNAIKFSPPQTVVTINAGQSANLVWVSVTDQGPGISPDQQAEIFDRFAQVQNPTLALTRAGFGLGLAFCRMASEIMGGTIRVESDGENGTSFIFTLPIYEEL